MRKTVCLTSLMLAFIMLSGCVGLSEKFNENDIVCRMQIYDHWNDKTFYYELDSKGNTRECEEFKPNAKKVYNEDGVNLLSFHPNLDEEKTFEIEYNKSQKTVSKKLMDKFKVAGLKFAYQEGYHDTWFSKLFEYDGDYYVEAMLNVNIACPYYLLKYDEKNEELVELWCGSEKEIKALEIIEDNRLNKNGQDKNPVRF